MERGVVGGAARGLHAPVGQTNVARIPQRQMTGHTPRRAVNRHGGRRGKGGVRERASGERRQHFERRRRKHRLRGRGGLAAAGERHRHVLERRGRHQRRRHDRPLVKNHPPVLVEFGHNVAQIDGRADQPILQQGEHLLLVGVDDAPPGDPLRGDLAFGDRADDAGCVVAVAGDLLPQQGEGERPEAELPLGGEHPAVTGRGSERGEPPLPHRVAVSRASGGERLHVLLQFLVGHVVQVGVVVGIVFRGDVRHPAAALDRVRRAAVLPVPRVVQFLAAHAERLVDRPLLPVGGGVPVADPFVAGGMPDFLHRPTVLDLRQRGGEGGGLPGRLNLRPGDALRPPHPPLVAALAVPRQELPDDPLTLEQPVRGTGEPGLHVAERRVGHALDQVHGAGEVGGVLLLPGGGHDHGGHRHGIDPRERRREHAEQLLDGARPLDPGGPLERSGGRRVGAAVLPGRQGDELGGEGGDNAGPHEPVPERVGRTERTSGRDEPVVRGGAGGGRVAVLLHRVDDHPERSVALVRGDLRWCDCESHDATPPSPAAGPTLGPTPGVPASRSPRPAPRSPAPPRGTGTTWGRG